MPGKSYTHWMKNPVGDIDARARQRVAWPVRKYRLADAPRDDIALAATAAERLAMMWPIALDAWSFTGRSLPDYARADAPVRVIRALGPDQRSSGSD